MKNKILVLIALAVFGVASFIAGAAAPSFDEINRELKSAVFSHIEEDGGNVRINFHPQCPEFNICGGYKTIVIADATESDVTLELPQ